MYRRQQQGIPNAAADKGVLMVRSLVCAGCIKGRGKNICSGLISCYPILASHVMPSLWDIAHKIFFLSLIGKSRIVVLVAGF